MEFINRMRSAAVLTAAVSCSVFSIYAAGYQVLHGTVPQAVASSKTVGLVDPSTRMSLAVGLPLRNQAELTELLAKLVNPASPDYRQYLTSAQFTARFGPTEADYEALAAFFEANGLEVTGRHPNRTILDVTGTVADIERTLHINMVRWSDPTRGEFFAPDREPSLNAPVTILDISGLDNFVIPRPMNLRVLPLSKATPQTTGSGPGGLFIGGDFRAAYAPSVTLNGTGQTVGLFELDGFYASDVAANFQQAGLTPVPVQTVLLDGFSGAPGSGNTEVTLDIMMAAYMAPGLTQIIVYEGTSWNDVLNRMATDNQAKQLSSSWTFSPTNATTEQIFQQMIAQGQSLFQASGDSGAYHGSIMPPADDPNVTVVGGTSLTTAGARGAWVSESAWADGGGGVSTTWPIPSYQSAVNMAAAGGSSTMRNIPDVSMIADVQSFLIANNGTGYSIGGTSEAAPLWAGFTALVNQQAVANQKPAVGFLNPAIYAIGQGSDYSSDLHDITTGSDGFAAMPGYDLATGWGSPTGQSLINDLSGVGNSPAFGLSLSPAALSVAPGASGSSTITVNAQNGFSSQVALAVSGLPNGVTASFSPATATSTSTLTLTVASSAVSGPSTLLITGTSGSLSSSVRLVLTVTGAPTFTITASPASVSVAPGASITSTITVNPLYGFTGTVALSASGLPTGVTASFSPASTTGTSTLTLTAASTASLGSSTVTITGTSGSLSITGSIGVTVASAPSFALTASPSSLSLAQGASGSSTISLVPQNGFTGGVNVSFSGVPTGVTAGWGSSSGMSVPLNFSVASSATPGAYTVTVNGVSGSLSAKATIALTITSPASFTLSATPASLSITQGASGASTITVNPANGFSGTVALAASGLPSGVTAAFSPASATGTSTLTLTAASNAATGSATVKITGTSGSLTSTTSIALTITAPASFTLSATPASLSITPGTSGLSTISVNPANGFSGTVALAASGLPSGVTAAFTGSTLTLTAASNAATGSATVKITGTSGNLTSTTSIALTVAPPPSFTLAATPASLTINQGASGTSTISVNPANGFSGTVALAASGLPSGVTAAFTGTTLTLTAAGNAATGAASVKITGTSGSLTSTTSIALTVNSAAGFTLSATPSSLSIAQGANGRSTITVNPANGFSGTVALAASGLPSGVTAAFTGTTLTLTAAVNATTGPATVKITGTSGSLTSTTSIALTITAPPSFTLSATPASLSITPGTSGLSTISVNPANGFSGTVALAASGLPSGVTAAFTGTTLTLTAASNAAAGSATVKITGTSGSLTSSATIALTITAPPSFTLSVTPASLTINQGASGTSTIAVNKAGGFAGTVALAASGLPSGVSAAFSPASTTGQSTLTLTASSTATATTATVTITGTSGSVTSKTSVSLTVAPQATFSLSFSPASVSIPQGGQGSSTLTLAAQNGFSGTVTIYLPTLPSGITGSFVPSPTGASLVFNLAVAKSAALGTSTVTVTAKSGNITQTANLNITVTAASAAATAVNLASKYNVSGIVMDGATFTSGGLDGGGRAYSENQLGTSKIVNGVNFVLGPASTSDAVSSTTIPLPAGAFSTVNLLAAAVNGAQTAQTFKVTYTDGTSTSFTQSLSDWCAPQGYSGESNAVMMSYRDNSIGTMDIRTVGLYGYRFNLTSGKTASSITLPTNRNVVVLAISMQ